MLDIDIYVYTQISNLYKWHKFSKSTVGGPCPKSLDAIYTCHSNGIHYDVVLDVSARTSDSSQRNSSEDSKINYFGSEAIFLPELSFQNHTDELGSESHKRFTNFWPINENSQKFMCLLLSLPLVVKHKFTSEKTLCSPACVKNIVGDGNCLFRALPYAITGRQVYYKQIRKKTVKHMREIESYIKPHINMSVAMYLTQIQMENEGVWETDVELLTAASLL